LIDVKRNRCVSVLLWFVLTGVAQAADRAHDVAFILNGRVHAIEDGDTLDLDIAAGQRMRVRLSDFDAPEIAHAENPRANSAAGRRRCPDAPRRAPGQPGGRAARRALAELAPPGSEVQAQCYEYDRYGRAICHLYRGGQNINRSLIAAGHGTLAPKARWIRDAESRAASAQAQRARRGVWRQPNPIQPTRWRQHCWCEGQCARS
jgi:endonuclease YncB( thermonuclease family)